jgi:hypothetical protein
MNEETRLALKDNIEALRLALEQGDPEMVAHLQRNLMAWRVIAEGEHALRREAELPTKHARVHAMGRAVYIGPVQSLGRGGYRVESHELLYHRAQPPAVEVRWVDVFAVHSVEYLTEAEWHLELERMHHEADASSKLALDDDSIPSDATAEAPAAETSERLGCANRIAGELTCGDDGCPKCYSEAMRAYLVALYGGPGEGESDDTWRERLDDLHRAMTIGQVAGAEEHLARSPPAATTSERVVDGGALSEVDKMDPNDFTVADLQAVGGGFGGGD